MTTPKLTNGNLPINFAKKNINYLTPEQLNSLTQAFDETYGNPKRYKKARGKYWLTFLFLRHTGARLNEVLSILMTQRI